MKSAFVKEPSIISVEDTEKPVLGSGDILVQMHACGICGSDLEKVFGQQAQEMKKLMKANKLNYKKENDLITIFESYNGL